MKICGLPYRREIRRSAKIIPSSHHGASHLTNVAVFPLEWFGALVTFCQEDIGVVWGEQVELGIFIPTDIAGEDQASVVFGRRAPNRIRR